MKELNPTNRNPIPFLHDLGIQLKEVLQSWGLSESLTKWIYLLIFVLIMIVVVWVIDKLTKTILVTSIKRLVRKTKTQYDDILLEKGVLKWLAHLLPALVVYEMLPTLFMDFPNWVNFFGDLTYIYMVFVGVVVILALFNSLNTIYMSRENAQKVPIKGYIQVIQIILILIAVVWAFSILFNFELKGFFTGLGAFAAVLILVFKDTILGVVASIQITANRMMSIGDWISVPSRNADGTVIDITVNTVKVQNWDKTIATIPTYALVTESFHNWRGMEESGGRRIKRALNMDMTSVKFVDTEMLERYRKIHLIREYVESRSREIEAYNKDLGVDDSVTVNGRRMTNIGTFRRYLEAYLMNHPKIHKEMTFLVRQLQPTEKGIPIEIYVFSTDQAWANYESIQADIFDHILAVLSQFDLRVFQEPTGHDFKSFGK